MTLPSIRRYDSESDSFADIAIRKHADGTYSEVFALTHDLQLGTKSLLLTLAANVGSVPIPDTANMVGVKPDAGTTMRVGLEAPEVDGAATGTALAADLKKGCPVSAGEWTYFTLPIGTSRVFHVRSTGAADKTQIVVL